MNSLLVTCRMCGRSGEYEKAGWTKDGLCVGCHTRIALREYRKDLLKLLGKRKRYMRSGISTASLDQQFSKLLRRCVRKAADESPDAKPELVQIAVSEFLTSIDREAGLL